MADQIIRYKVFIASPGGLNAERKKFSETLHQYNLDEALHDKIYFEPVGWELTLPGKGRPQSLINEQLKECDYFILLMHDRWGSNPGTSEYNATSGTEEEYLLALDCSEDSSLPMKDVVCLFKSVSENQLADPGKELKKVLKFKKEIEKNRELLYSNFSSLSEFESQIRQLLGKWRRDGGQTGNSGGGYFPPQPPSDLPLGSNIKEEMTSDHSGEANIDKFIEKLRKLVKEGKLVDAEIEYSRALINDPSPKILLSYSNFLLNIGQIDKAMLMVEKSIQLATLSPHDRELSKSYNSKGEILLVRGNINDAEIMFQNSLKISQKLDESLEIANTYLRLGRVYLIRGELDSSESMVKKSLAIYEKHKIVKGMANCYSSLGNIYSSKGDINRSEDMYKKALQIYLELDELLNMARNYGNLGVIYMKRNNLDKAEEVLNKSLVINEKLGRPMETADIYGNLGILYEYKGDLDQAIEMYQKSLSIEESLNRLRGMASDYGNLGGVYYSRKDFDKAEEMFLKSLDISERLGYAEGVASQYGNLGILYSDMSDLNKAQEMFEKAYKVATDSGFSEIENIAIDHIKRVEELKGRNQ